MPITRSNHRPRNVPVAVTSESTQNPSLIGSDDSPSPTSDATPKNDVSKKTTPARGGMTSSDDPVRSSIDDNTAGAQGSGEGSSNERPR